MKKLKVGIIGCGGIANQKHLPALKQSNDLAEIVAFCDIRIERAEKAAKEYGVSNAKVYKDYHQLLEDRSIDVVHICTPNVFHAPMTVDAFEAGKNVLCEKPMSHSADEAQKMIEAWKKSGKHFTIGYQNRFRKEIQLLHKACREGELGDIYFAKAHALRRRAVPTWGVFQDKAQQGGGPLIDIGTHALDITLWMMDNYEPVSVMGSVFYKMSDKVEGNLFGPWDPSTFEVEDSAFGFIKMKNGATIFLEASWVLNIIEEREAATTLCGTEAGAEIRGAMTETPQLIFNKEYYGELAEIYPVSRRGGVAYFSGDTPQEPGVIEARQWLMSIINDTDALVKPQEAFIVTKILDAIYKSAEQDKQINL